jgi:hypothetical protein
MDKREARVILQAIADGYTGTICDGFIVVENPDATPQNLALGGVDPNLVIEAKTLIALLWR